MSIKSMILGGSLSALVGCTNVHMGDNLSETSNEDFVAANEVCQVELTNGVSAEVVHDIEEQIYLLVNANGYAIGDELVGFKGNNCGYGYNEKDGSVSFTDNSEEVKRINQLIAEHKM